MPAKRGPFAGDPTGARRYLANLIASDQWHAAKELSQYQDGQVIRKANAFHQQEQAGLPLDNKASRGHADILPQRVPSVPSDRRQLPPLQRPTGPIIGGQAPTQPAPAPRARKDEKIFRPPKVPMDTKINGPRGSYQLNTTRFKDVVHELKEIQKAHGPDAKVYFSLWDNRKGDWQKLYVQKGVKSANNGVRVGDLLARMKAAVKGGLSHTERLALIDSWQADIDGGNAGGSTTPDDLDLPEVFTTIGVHVMGA
jgi:hypothetical protein